MPSPPTSPPPPASPPPPPYVPPWGTPPDGPAAPTPPLPGMPRAGHIEDYSFARAGDPQGQLATDDPDHPVKYWPIWTNFGERYTRGASGTTSAEVLLDWGDVTKFLKHAIGWVEYVPASGGTPARLRRRLPMLCPFSPGEYCGDIEIVSYGGGKRADAAAQNWVMCDWATYKLGFSTLPYEIKTDAQISAAGGDESLRYVSVKRRTDSRERQISAQGFETVDGGVKLNVPAFLPDLQVIYTFVWHEVPSAALNLDLPYLNVNATDWSVAGFTFPAKTALFKGIPEEIVEYRGPDGVTMLVDVKYEIAWRAEGWNKVKKNDGTSVEIWSIGTHKPPYVSGDLTKLFKVLGA